MKEQVRASYRETGYKNSAMPILQLYLERKMLADLGYRFDPEDLTDWEVKAFAIIEAELSRCQKAEHGKRNKH